VKTQTGREETAGAHCEAQQAARPFAIGGWAGWLLARLRDSLRRSPRPRPHLALVERIPLAPRQSLALVEAEGRRLLVATSAEGCPVFYPLDAPPRAAAPAPMLSTARSSARRARSSASAAKSSPRVSW
jgi:flagellar biogenesis protein FliO